MHLPTGQGLGLHRLRGHLGWVLLTSDLGSFATADLRGGQQPSSELTMHWELAWREHQAWDGDRTFLKRGRRDPNHISMPAPEHGSALGSGQAVANSPNKTKQSCPFPAVLSLLSFLYCPFSANQTSPKIERLSPDPPFPPPKGRSVLLHGFKAAENIWHLAASLPNQYQFSSCDESPQELEFKNEQSGRFFPHYKFFFSSGKVISQKFCWTKV